MTLKLKRILISILCVLSCVCGTVALNFNATSSTYNASAEVIESVIPDVKDFYMLGAKKAFPTFVENVLIDPTDADSPTITASYGVIYYPNGIPYSIVENKEYALDILGTYTLKYFGDYDGKEIVVKSEFKVLDSLYALSSEGSSFIDYATAEYLATQTDYVPRSQASRNVTDTKLTYSGREALSVNLNEGAQFIYSKPIDLREVGNDGLTNLISFEPRSEDYDYGYVTYTDQNANQVYDSQGRALYKQDINKDGNHDRVGYSGISEASKTPDTVQVGTYLYIPFLDENADGVPDVNIIKSYYITKAIARELVITLTDCYDSSKYIKLMVSTQQSTSTASLSPTPYVKAATDNFTQYYGLWSVQDSESHIKSHPTTGSTNVSGKPNIVLSYPEGRRIAWTTQNENVWHYGGKVGGYEYNKLTYDYMNLKYDFETSTVFASSTANDGTETTPYAFTDFHNEILYPASLGGFRGFTTGEVYLSVSFDKYIRDDEPARVDIFSIGGESVSDMFDREYNQDNDSYKYNPQKYQDTVAPEIQIDFTQTIDNGVNVAVGDWFTIPSAKATDVSLAGGVSYNVYLNYGTPNYLLVPVVDGRIKITKNDTYSIVYTAKDQAGNVATEVINVFGANAENTISILHDEAQFSQGIKAGAINTFVKPTKIQSLNLLAETSDLIKSKFKLKIEIVSDFEKILVTDLTGLDAIEEFFNSEFKYRLSYAGSYKVIYYFADNAVNNYDNPITVNFTVAESDALAIYDQPLMYRHYIKDAYYDFDKVVAYKFTTGKPEYASDAKLWISFDGNDYVEQSSVYGIKITGDKTIQAKYVCDGEFVETDVYPIIDVGYANQTADTELVDFSNYFVSEDLKIDTASSDLLYVTNKTDGSNSLLQYIKTVDISTLGLTYRIVQDQDNDYSNFTGIKFIFTDIYDQDNKFTIYKYKEGGQFYVKYNDQAPKKLDGSFIGENKSFSFMLDAQILQVSDLSDYFRTDVAFKTNEAYLDIELCGITGDAGVSINVLNKCKLKREYQDRDMPSFIGVVPSGTFSVGDYVTIGAARFIDDSSIIIKDNTSMTVSFNGEYLTSVDGIKLDGSQDPTRSYQILVNERGDYNVIYSAKDNFNHVIEASYSLTVRDNVAPTIKFSGSIKEDVIVYAKPGYTVKLAFSMNDNYTPTKELTFKIFVLNKHTTTMYAVPSGEKSFKLTSIGTYDVSVVCYDTEGNKTTKTFTVVISNEEVK